MSLVSMWLGAKRTALHLLLLATVWLYLCSTALFADFLMGTLESDYPPTPLAEIQQAGAIVLLGGAARGDTQMSSRGDLNQQADRLVYATALYKAGKAPLVLVTGGAATGQRPEAQLMLETLTIMGVPDSAILLENKSRNTHDNALYSAAILNEHRIDRVLLVTSAFHMRRAEGLFRAQGIEVVPAPTDYQRLLKQSVLPGWLPGVEALTRTTYALREHAGLWVYRWRGWL